MMQLQRELHASKEQLQFLRETHRICCGMISLSPSSLSVNQSRPNSFLSVTSSASDPVDENEDRTDTLTDGNLKEVENEEEKKIRFVSDEEINEEQEDENTHLVDVSEENKKTILKPEPSADDRP
ncbi:uncharacterized protein LOC143231682 isoform X2 [Tachypleus tridentatus]|uniref:uncharacterized protein LOC143231682 isoform X2 n=1 Tax=Tachypleus tridentatus TaxID=6853 RepID=UPI003FD2F5FA